MLALIMVGLMSAITVFEVKTDKWPEDVAIEQQQRQEAIVQKQQQEIFSSVAPARQPASQTKNGYVTK